MNTTDVKYNGQIKSFEEMLVLAREQFEEYEKIEGIDDWSKYDFSIDCSCDQMKFKDMLQIRFIEELTEASTAIDDCEEHFWEEIGDALNFFLSAYIMCGADFNKLKDPQKFLPLYGIKERITSTSKFSLEAYPVIEAVGSLCNLLKNRPWTESNFLVSIYDFNIRLSHLWDRFWIFMGNMNLTRDDVFEMFYKKLKVNEHRRSTGY